MKNLLLAAAFLVASPFTFAQSESSDNSIQACGYWEYYEVEVCDERQVPVTKNITLCEYMGPRVNGEFLEFIQQYDGHIQCPAPAPTLRLTWQSHTTKTTYETERYNCRMEERRIWIYEGGPGCGGFDPR